MHSIRIGPGGPLICLLLAVTLPVVLAMPPAAQHWLGPNMPHMGTTYSGFATYYGTPPMPGNSHVHCHLPNIGKGSGYANIQKTIAVSADQYMGSRACGLCAEVWGSGYMCPGGQRGPHCGLGNYHDRITDKFLAVVTDELKERRGADIDIGEYGDGHYPVQWKPVPCPWDDNNARVVLHAGGNNHYLKVQFRYLNSPMESVELLSGNVAYSQRTHDNFFMFQANVPGHGWNYDGNGQLEFRARSMLGTHYCGKVDRMLHAEDYEYWAWKC